MSKPIVYSTLKMKKILFVLYCKDTTEYLSCQANCFITYVGKNKNYIGIKWNHGDFFSKIGRLFCHFAISWRQFYIFLQAC